MKQDIINCNGKGIRGIVGQNFCDGKYEIREFIDRGSFGAVFLVLDGNKRMALKFTEDAEILANEISVIKSIRHGLKERQSDYIPEVVDWGVLILNNFSSKSDEPGGALIKLMKYYIMPLYGYTL